MNQKHGWNQRPTGWQEIKQTKFSKKNHSHKISNIKKYNQEVIFILAGGLNEEGENHDWVKRRLDAALDLYQQKKRKIICLGGGTYHKPPALNEYGYVIHESSACIKYLLEKGVQVEDLMREWSSYDTIANSFFSLLNFTIPMNLRNILVITSDFHMPRTRAIFEWIYSLQSDTFTEVQIEYLEVTSDGLDSEIINIRKLREEKSLLDLQEKISKIKTLESFHTWFFNQHKAYNCYFVDNIPGKSDSNLNPNILKTY